VRAQQRDGGYDARIETEAVKGYRMRDLRIQRGGAGKDTMRERKDHRR